MYVKVQAVVHSVSWDQSGTTWSVPESYKSVGEVNGMERPAGEGDSPVSEAILTLDCDPEYHGARETLWEPGRTIFQG